MPTLAALGEFGIEVAGMASKRCRRPRRLDGVLRQPQVLQHHIGGEAGFVVAIGRGEVGTGPGTGQ